MCNWDDNDDMEYLGEKYIQKTFMKRIFKKKRKSIGKTEILKRKGKYLREKGIIQEKIKYLGEKENIQKKAII